VNSAGARVTRKVFLSSARDDHVLAQRIGDALNQSGISVATGTTDLSPGENWMERLEETIHACDVMVVLLTPAALTSEWITAEVAAKIGHDLDRRGADLIPVLGAAVDLPPALKNRAVVDLTENLDIGLQHLVAQIKIASYADFSALSWQAFEQLVADLLRAVGFQVEDMRRGGDTGIDLRATYQRTDPFGLPETEVWLVETKLYGRERVSVQVIRALAGTLAMSPGNTRGLLVTNAQLTSVALDVLADIKRLPNIRLQVLDGNDLKQLLKRFPSVADRYFGPSAVQARPVSDGNA